MKIELESKQLEQKITCCKLCKQLNVLKPVPPFMLVKSDILVIGESPKGKLVNSFSSHTFKRLDEELALLGIRLQDCSFTELCKCELLDRKYFKKVAKNCVVNLEGQLLMIEPSLIISIGVTTLDVINEHFKPRNTIGKLGSIAGYTYLPLYHPSPANPRGHKNNLKILNNVDLKL